MIFKIVLGTRFRSQALVDLKERKSGKLPCATLGVYFTITIYYWSFLSKFLTDTDVDECQEKYDNCHLHASCKNTAGSFECFCHDGFTGNGRFCAGTGVWISRSHLPEAKANAVWLLYSNLYNKSNYSRILIGSSYDQLEDRRKDDVINIFWFLYYIKQIDSMLPCVFSVIDHRRRQDVVTKSVKHSPNDSRAPFMFLPHFDVICELFLRRRRL